MLEHDLANRLLDCAAAEDREGYARERGRIRSEHPVQAPWAEALTRIQISMWRDFRHFGWRTQYGDSKK